MSNVNVRYSFLVCVQLPSSTSSSLNVLYDFTLHYAQLDVRGCIKVAAVVAMDSLSVSSVDEVATPGAGGSGTANASNDELTFLLHFIQSAEEGVWVQEDDHEEGVHNLKYTQGPFTNNKSSHEALYSDAYRGRDEDGDGDGNGDKEAMLVASSVQATRRSALQWAVLASQVRRDEPIYELRYLPLLF